MSDFYRGRRLRRTNTLRAMVRETRLSLTDLVFPLFLQPGNGIAQPIASMPGQYRYSLDKLADVARGIAELGIPAVLLFAIPEVKDAAGSDASCADGVVQKACAILKKEVPQLCVITDLCLCEYTSHGHCGILAANGEVDNDLTLLRLREVALSQANAGADIIAPSDMMDGRIAVIREALDANDFADLSIMSYAAKYASAFYGPFREAAESTPQCGDRYGYQMDPANRREALREMRADVQQGADIIMVKPALGYQDIIADARREFDLPIAAYNVSGEYSMVKVAAEQGLLDEKRAVLEILTGLKRAGADIIISYHACDAARLL